MLVCRGGLGRTESRGDQRGQEGLQENPGSGGDVEICEAGSHPHPEPAVNNATVYDLLIRDQRSDCFVQQSCSEPHNGEHCSCFWPNLLKCDPPVVLSGNILGVTFPEIRPKQNY